MAYKLKQTGKKVQDLLDSIEAFPPENMVDLTSEQTITAAKTFSAGISLNGTRMRKVKTPTANDDAANKQYVDNSTLAKPDIFILSSDRTMAEAVDAINKKMFIVIKAPSQYADYGYLFADYACIWSDGSPMFFFHYTDNRGVYELKYFYDVMEGRWETSQREYTIPDYNYLVRLSGKQTITGEKTFSAGVDLNGTRISKVGSPVNTDDAANKEYVDDFAATKQDVLTAGKGIVIDDNNTISINLDPDIFKVVSVLPEAPAAGDEKKIHLVPSDYSESGNAYDEYIYVDGSWEKIGYFKPSIDLSEYAKTADIPVEKGAGDNSIVQKGGNNVASGKNSTAYGNSSNAIGMLSHAEGDSTSARGYASHSEGQATNANNSYEHAEGKCNKSILGKTIHTVGIGTKSGDGRNAHEIHLDGKHYIYGIGGYDGANSQDEGIKTVQEVAEEVATKVASLEAKNTALESRIAELENIISQISIKEE